MKLLPIVTINKNIKNRENSITFLESIKIQGVILDHNANAKINMSLQKKVYFFYEFIQIQFEHIELSGQNCFNLFKYRSLICNK